MSSKNTKSNVQLVGLIQLLRKISTKHNVKIWKSIAEELEKPSRNKRIVNLYKLQKFTKENETIIVPGKVLGTGTINHKIAIAAWNFSESAKVKIKSANGMCLTIPELIEKNPKGEKVRILG